MHHADGGYSRRGNFGGSLVNNMIIIYSLNGYNVCGSRDGQFGGWKLINRVPRRALFIRVLRHLL